MKKELDPVEEIKIAAKLVIIGESIMMYNNMWTYPGQYSVKTPKNEKQLQDLKNQFKRYHDKICKELKESYNKDKARLHDYIYRKYLLAIQKYELTKGELK
jgi:hypothetical protein